MISTNARSPFKQENSVSNMFKHTQDEVLSGKTNSDDTEAKAQHIGFVNVDLLSTLFRDTKKS